MTDDTIETLRSADIEVVAKLHARSFYDAWEPSMIRQVLDMPGAWGMVARRGGYGSIIGFSLSRVTADECELLSLGVAAEHRSRGVGGLLLTAAMARATAERARWFFLEVAEDNAAALQLYAAHGMNRVGQRPNYYENADGSRTDALTMRRPLPLLPAGGK